MENNMKLIAARLFVLSCVVCSTSFAQTSAPLVRKENLVYQGAFRVPQGTDEDNTFNYGGTSLAFNPANNSLFMTGHDWTQVMAEIRIPTLVNSTSVGSLNTGSLVQNFRDAFEGKLGSINPGDPNSKKVGGTLVYNGKLIMTGYSYYDGAGTQNSSHFSRPLSFATTGQVQGPYRLSGPNVHFVSGYMSLIPPEWQSALGGPALTGNCCLAIAAVQSNGPSVSVFDPNTLSNGPAKTVVGYPLGNELGPGEASTNMLYNLTTKVRGVVFPNGTRSVLFFGRHGVGTYCYGTGEECNDPADNSKGTHAYPYRYQVWAYDANDLVAVKNGTKQAHAVEPYSVWNFNLPFEGSGGQHLIGGAAYDAQTGRIYVSQQCSDTNCAPVIHAFKVDGSATVAVPRAPTNVATQ
jgi:hypothetical protein